MKSRWTPLAFLVSVIPLTWLIARFNFLCDDAFISYRYASNFAEGLGLCFNPGTQPPVEGYTNLLWVLWCAIFEGLELDVGFYSRATSIALAYGLLFLVLRLIGKRHAALAPPQQLLASLAGGLLIGLHPAFATWSTSGMETMAFAFCLFLGFERLASDPSSPRGVQASLALIAAILLRADGFVAVAGVLLGLLVWSRMEQSEDLRRTLLKVGVAVGVAVALNFAFRLVVHGDLLPNTAHAKVNLGSVIAWKRGGIYVAHFLLLFPAVALAPFLAQFPRASFDRKTRCFAIAASIPFGVIYLWYLAVGGDYMAFGRFLVPAIPFAAVLFAGGFAQASTGILRGAFAVLLLVAQILPAFGVSAVPESVLSRLNFRLHKDYESQVEAWEGLAKGVERGTLKGRLLLEYTQPGDSLVAGAVGAQAYYSGLYIYDRLGLITREVGTREVESSARAAGHDKGVPAEFFLKDSPTIMHLDLTSRAARGEIAIPASLAGEYVAREIVVQGGRWLRLIVHRDSHLAGQ